MLVRLMRQERYHVVHTHNPLAAFIGRIAARISRIPIIIYTVHGFNFHEGTPRLRRSLSMVAERIVGRWTHLVFSQSKEDYELIVRSRIVKPNRALWIGNGIDPVVFDSARFAPEDRRRIRVSLGIPDNARVAGMLTRYSSEKGMFEFIRAAAAISLRMPEAWFMIVGGAIWGKSNRPTDESLRAYAEEHGIAKRLVLPGFRKDAPAMMAAMDVFCLPSYREGLPRSIIEAMAMELPVVASDIRGCREEVVDGETGFLIPVRDSRALADKLTYLLENPQVACEFGRRARAIVLEDFVEADVVQKQITVIKQTLARNRRD
jgi:glycosyltransferase involved in cell wall biosynthesis